MRDSLRLCTNHRVSTNFTLALVQHSALALRRTWWHLERLLAAASAHPHPACRRRLLGAAAAALLQAHARHCAASCLGPDPGRQSQTCPVSACCVSFVTPAVYCQKWRQLGMPLPRVSAGRCLCCVQLQMILLPRRVPPHQSCCYTADQGHGLVRAGGSAQLLQTRCPSGMLPPHRPEHTRGIIEALKLTAKLRSSVLSPTEKAFRDDESLWEPPLSDGRVSRSAPLMSEPLFAAACGTPSIRHLMIHLTTCLSTVQETFARKWGLPADRRPSS